jgi:nicotinate phosphoribosyltransferase
MEPRANGKAFEDLGKPTNPMVSALLTDMYQFTMAYAYWKANKHLDIAV